MQHYRTDNPFILHFDSTDYVQNKPLSGLRLAVKDLFHVQGIPTTAGNPNWLNTHDLPQVTATPVTQLIQDGCILTGKTITDELAYSLNGQNIHYGTPFNDKYPQQLPGGSSSGSAIAVANGLADIGLGTDTGGSIRVPASYNHLFGFRPTHVVISTENMVGLAPAFDTVGWLCRDFDIFAQVAHTLLPELPPSKTVEQWQIACPTALLHACEHQNLVQGLLDKLKSNHRVSQLDSPFDLPNLQQAAECFRVLQAWQIWSTHGQWIEENKGGFAPDIAQRFKACQAISRQQQQQAQLLQDKFKGQLQRLFARHDFILLPTTPGRAPLQSSSALELASYRTTLMSMTCIAGLGGLPQLHLPLGCHQGRPVGLSIIGPAHSDKLLFSVATYIQELLN
jgi:Asp-tRNA(Asn)/Glu-tRNA(Gln) amidotransferase A subunit family amidase